MNGDYVVLFPSQLERKKDSKNELNILHIQETTKSQVCELKKIYKQDKTKPHLCFTQNLGRNKIYGVKKISQTLLAGKIKDRTHFMLAQRDK